MAHETRRPSIKLVLERELFNHLISMLDYNIEMKIEVENFSQTASKLKQKLLTYSVLRKEENDLEFVDVRFFPNEASDLIYQLLARTEVQEVKEDYSSKLYQKQENH